MYEKKNVHLRKYKCQYCANKNEKYKNKRFASSLNCLDELWTSSYLPNFCLDQVFHMSSVWWDDGC